MTLDAPTQNNHLAHPFVGSSHYTLFERAEACGNGDELGVGLRSDNSAAAANVSLVSDCLRTLFPHIQSS